MATGSFSASSGGHSGSHIVVQGKEEPPLLKIFIYFIQRLIRNPNSACRRVKTTTAPNNETVNDSVAHPCNCWDSR